MTPLDVLIEARQLLLDRGIARRKFHDLDTSALCAVAAVRRVHSSTNVRAEAFNALYDVIGVSAARFSGWSISQFNDTHTDAEIIEMFDTAIRNLQERAQ